MVQALLESTVVCLFLRGFNDALAILAIVLAYAVFGMLQEQKAENSLDALKQMTAPSARVLREGRMLEIPAAELVPGASEEREVVRQITEKGFTAVSSGKDLKLLPASVR